MRKEDTLSQNEAIVLVFIGAFSGAIVTLLIVGLILWLT